MEGQGLKVRPRPKLEFEPRILWSSEVQTLPTLQVATSQDKFTSEQRRTGLVVQAQTPSTAEAKTKASEFKAT